MSARHCGCGVSLESLPSYYRQCRRCYALTRRQQELAAEYDRGYRDGYAAGLTAQRRLMEQAA